MTARSNLPAILQGLQDELSYVIECLLEDYTGEAKSELGSLIHQVNAAQLDDQTRATLALLLGDALQELRRNNSNSHARSALVTVRRQLYNTRLQLAARPLKYNFADPFPGCLR